MQTIKMVFLTIIVSLFASAMMAQVSVNLNVGAPIPGRYYYLQDIGAYYDNNTSMYIYFSGHKWRHARELPPSFGPFDFNNGHKVLMEDYRGDRPYQYNREHRVAFPKGRYAVPDKNHWSVKDHNARPGTIHKEANAIRKENNRMDNRANPGKGKDAPNMKKGGKGKEDHGSGNRK